jgi:MFS family permease
VTAGATEPSESSESSEPGGGGIFAVLAHRQYALLWAGAVVSFFGDCVQLFGQVWLVADTTGSAMALGSVGLAQAVPRLVIGVFAGVVVDRLDRRAVLLVVQSLAALQSLAFLALLVTGRLTLPWIVALSAAQGVLAAVGTTARVALMPELVPRPLIGRAIALYTLGANVAQLAAPAAAGLLIASVGMRGCLAVNLGTFGVVLGALAVMAPHPPAQRAGKESLGASLVAGFALARSQPLLWGTLLLTYALGLFGASASQFLALYAQSVLHVQARGYGMLVVATGVGALLASLLVTARTRADQQPSVVLGAATAFAVMLGVVGLSRSYPLTWVALLGLGFTQTAFRSAVTAVLQLGTPGPLLGRVMSLMTLDFAMWSLGAVVVGAVADRLVPVFAAHPLAMGGLLPPDAVGSSLAVTLGAMAVTCLIATVLLVRPIRSVQLGAGPPSTGTAPGTAQR